MPWSAVVPAVAAIGGAVMSSDAARSAGNKQSDAASSAANAQLQQFNTINDQQAPYRNAGYRALNDLSSGFGVAPSTPKMSRENFDQEAYLAANPALRDQKVWTTWNNGGNDFRDYYDNWVASGSNPDQFTGTQTYSDQLQQAKAGSNAPGFGGFNHEFNANDLNANLAPNYQFMLDQGLGQVRNQANSVGGLVGGNALQGLNTFAQNYAQNAYQQAYQNYNTNKTNIFNRLASIAGIGQTANNTSAQYGAGATQAASNYLTSGAAAQAAGNVGQANAISSGLGSAGNYALLSSFLKGGGSSGSGGWAGGDTSGYGAYA